MAEQIWIRQGNDVQGPFPRAKILDLMQQGKILSTMLLSGDGRNWQMATEAAELLVDDAPEPEVVGMPVEPAAPHRVPHGGRSRRRPPRRPAGRPPPRSSNKNASTWIVVGIVGVLAVGALVGFVVLGGGDAEPEPSALEEHLTAAQVVERCEKSVALIKDKTSSGTGFMVADGVLATNSHVVRQMILGEMEVVFPSVSRRRLAVDKILHLDDKWDVCLLSVRANHRPLELRPDAKVKRGAELLIIGNPGVGDEIVIENAVSRGLAGGLTTIRHREFLQISAPINPGNSGGPVLDDAGRVLGMVTMKAVAKESLAFAVPAREIVAALREAEQRSNRALKKLNEKHLAGAIFLRLDLAGRAYLVLVMAYVDGVRRAINEGATTVEEATPYLPDISEAVGRVQETVGKDLHRYIDFIEAAGWLDDEARENLLDFQQIVQMFESRASNRDVLSVISHVSEFDNLFGRFTALEEDLRLRFGLPQEEPE